MMFLLTPIFTTVWHVYVIIRRWSRSACNYLHYLGCTWTYSLLRMRKLNCFARGKVGPKVKKVFKKKTLIFILRISETVSNEKTSTWKTSNVLCQVGPWIMLIYDYHKFVYSQGIGCTIFYFLEIITESWEAPEIQAGLD